MVRPRTLTETAEQYALTMIAWFKAAVTSLAPSGLARLFAWLLTVTPVTKQKRLTRVRALGQRLDLVAVMLTVIIAGVVGYVGINVMNNTRDQTSLASGDAFFASQENLTDGLESFFGQIGTVFTVIILVVIVSYLTLLRGR